MSRVSAPREAGETGEIDCIQVIIYKSTIIPYVICIT